MPIVDTDIKVYGSVVMADDDITTNIGGAIDLTRKVDFSDTTIIATPDEVEIVSDSALDDHSVTLTGRNAAGELITSTKTMAGATPVAFTGTFKSLLKCVVTGAVHGNIIVRVHDVGATLMTMAIGQVEVRKAFYAALAEESGGATRKYYEKIFFKNTHATLSLTSAVISEFADPSTVTAFLVENTLDGSGDNGAFNRQTSPGGTFDSTAKNVVNSQNLTAGSAQGVWCELSLVAGLAPANTSFTMRCTGNTT